MDECMDGMFEKWYDKIDEEDSMEDRRKVHHSPITRKTRTIVWFLGRQMALSLKTGQSGYVLKLAYCYSVV